MLDLESGSKEEGRQSQPLGAAPSFHIDHQSTGSLMGNGKRIEEASNPSVMPKEKKTLAARDDYVAGPLGRFQGPLPVEDVFQFYGARVTILLRLLFQGLLLTGIGGLSFPLPFVFVAIILVLRIIIIVLRILGKPIRGDLSAIRILFILPQICWEYNGTKVYLKSKHRFIIRIWWMVYLVIADFSDFEHNFSTAWSRKPVRFSTDTYLFLGNMKIVAPIRCEEADPTHEALIQDIKMFYRIMKTKRGLPELLIPRRLQRIDTVDIKEGRIALGKHSKTLYLGRPLGSAVSLFHNPKGYDGSEFKKDLDVLGGQVGLEFIRGLNPTAVTAVILSPAVASLIFAAAWTGVWIRKGVETQLAVGTAFTIASYLVTAGSFIVALVAYLDSRQGDSEDGLQGRPEVLINTAGTLTERPNGLLRRARSVS